MRTASSPTSATFSIDARPCRGGGLGVPRFPRVPLPRLRWARRAMDLYPDIEWVYATADKPEKQTSDIEDMMVKGIDGLVILATESAPMTPIAKRAHEKGIFIVNVDRGFLPQAGPIADIFL